MNKYRIILLTMVGLIIGINGLAGSGKDTVCNYLINKYNNAIEGGFKRLSFASALKNIVSILTGWSYEYLDGSTDEHRLLRETEKHKIYNKTGREILRYVGTELLRDQFNKDIWLNIVENDIDKYKDLHNIIITDCRFTNEIDMIKRKSCM